MLKRGAFTRSCRLRAGGAIYLKLGGADGGKARPFKPSKTPRVRRSRGAAFRGSEDACSTNSRTEDAAICSRPFPKFMRQGDGLRPSRPRRANGRSPRRTRRERAPLQARGRSADAQRSASDPESSAWVSANAGSGKTHVLAQRVVRLLLAGAKPSSILCLTFTKAAAANMADARVQTLAKWTKLDDEALAAEIVEAGAPQPSRRTRGARENCSRASSRRRAA